MFTLLLDVVNPTKITSYQSDSGKVEISHDIVGIDWAIRNVSGAVLLSVNGYGIPDSYPKLIKIKNLKVILNELSPNRTSNAIDKCIIITFSLLNNPYPCHPYML